MEWKKRDITENPAVRKEVMEDTVTLKLIEGTIKEVIGLWIDMQEI